MYLLIHILLFIYSIYNMGGLPFLDNEWVQHDQLSNLTCDTTKLPFNQKAVDKLYKDYIVDVNKRTVSLDANGMWKLTHYCNPDGTAYKATLWINRDYKNIHPDSETIMFLLEGFTRHAGGGPELTLPIAGETIDVPLGGKIYGAVHKVQKYNIVIISIDDVPIKENLRIERSDKIHIKQPNMFNKNSKRSA